jgi:hypothetical protein
MNEYWEPVFTLAKEFMYKIISPTTDIPWEVADYKFSVYPNPAEGFVLLKLPEEISSIDFSITNMQGMKIQAGKMSRPKMVLDLSAIPSGIYLLNGQTNETHFTEKIIIID